MLVTQYHVVAYPLVRDAIPVPKIRKPMTKLLRRPVPVLGELRLDVLCQSRMKFEMTLKV